MNELTDIQHRYLSLLIEAGCKAVRKDFLFGKEYVWMKDSTGAVFLERLPHE